MTQQGEEVEPHMLGEVPVQMIQPAGVPAGPGHDPEPAPTPGPPRPAVDGETTAKFNQPQAQMLPIGIVFNVHFHAYFTRFDDWQRLVLPDWTDTHSRRRS